MPQISPSAPTLAVGFLTKIPGLEGLESVVCFEWRQDEPVKIGRIVSTLLPGRQTVHRGELYGILLFLQNTTGDVDATVDCLGVIRR